MSKIIRASKKLYFSKLFNKHKNDLKYTWTLLNGLINSKINIHNLIEPEVNNKIITHGVVAEAFNYNFSNVGPNLKNEINPVNVSFTEYLLSSVQTSMYMTICTPSEVFNIIKNMKVTRNNVSKLGSITLK